MYSTAQQYDPNIIENILVCNGVSPKMILILILLKSFSQELSNSNAKPGGHMFFRGMCEQRSLVKMRLTIRFH